MFDEEDDFDNQDTSALSTASSPGITKHKLTQEQQVGTVIQDQINRIFNWKYRFWMKVRIAARVICSLASRF